MVDMAARTKARITGFISLLTVILGGIGESVSSRVLVPNHPGATATALFTQPGLVRFGFAAYLIEMACKHCHYGPVL